MAMDGATLDRYMRGLIEAAIPRPKELFATINGPATDALAEALASAAAELAAPSFSIASGAHVTWAKVWGNPWDLHDAMAGLRALSERFATLSFAIRLDDLEGQLRAGTFVDVPFAELSAWVTAHPRPRFEEVDVRATLKIRSSPAAGASIHHALSRFDTLRITDTRDGLDIAIDRVDQLASIVGGALRVLGFAADAWRCEISLAGAIWWRYTVRDFAGALALPCLLGTMLRDIPSAVELVDEPVPDLAPAPALARLAMPDVLELEISERCWAMRSSDGVFVPLPASGPALGDASPVSRHELGVVGSDHVVIELTLQLGRIRRRIIVRAADGAERASREFINTSAVALDIDRARLLLTAERDGAPELLAVDLATFAETCLRVFAGEPAPHTLFVRGEIHGLVMDPRATRLVRYAGGTREPIAEVAGSLELCTRVDDVLLMITQVFEFDHERNRSVRDDCLLHEISLGDGRVRSVSLGPGRSEMVSRRDAWLAWWGRGLSVVRVFEGTQLRRELPIPPGQQLWSLAISSSGAVARVLTDDLSARSVHDVPRNVLLEVSRGDELAACVMPVPLTVQWAR